MRAVTGGIAMAGRHALQQIASALMISVLMIFGLAAAVAEPPNMQRGNAASPAALGLPARFTLVYPPFPRPGDFGSPIEFKLVPPLGCDFPAVAQEGVFGRGVLLAQLGADKKNGGRLEVSLPRPVGLGDADLRRSCLSIDGVQFWLNRPLPPTIVLPQFRRFELLLRDADTSQPLRDLTVHFSRLNSPAPSDAPPPTADGIIDVPPPPPLAPGTPICLGLVSQDATMISSEREPSLHFYHHAKYLFPGTYVLRVNAKGYEPKAEQLEITADAPGLHTIYLKRNTLGEAGRISGMALGSRDGLPVAHQPIEARIGTGLIRVTAHTNAQGEFTFHDLMPAQWTISAVNPLAPPGTPQRRQPPTSINLHEGGQPAELPTEGLVVQVNQGVGVAGALRDADTSAPLAGVGLRLAAMEAEEVLPAAETTSTAEGVFLFEEVDAATPHVLELSDKRAYILVGSDPPVPGLMGTGLPLPLGAGGPGGSGGASDVTTAPAPALTLLLRPRAVVRGQVLGADGAEARNAGISLRALAAPTTGSAAPPSSGPFATVAEAGGRFELGVYPAGEYEIIATQGASSSAPQRVRLASGENPPLTLKMAAGFELRGLVLGSDEQRVTGALVRAIPQDEAPEPGTDGSTTAAAAPQEFADLGPDDTPPPLSPRAQSARTAATPAGTFTLPAISSSDVLLQATHPAFASVATLRLADARLAAATSGPLRLVFPGAAQFSALAKDARSGAPLAGVEVQMMLRDSGGRLRSVRRHTDGAGRLQVGGLPAGAQLERLVASVESHARLERTAIALPQTDYLLELTPLGALTVTVRGLAEEAARTAEAAAAPKQESGVRGMDDILRATPAAAGMRVWLYGAVPAAGTELAAAEPEIDAFIALGSQEPQAGRVRFQNLAPGWYRAALAASSGSYTETERALRLTGEEAALELAPQPTALLDGRVVGTGGPAKNGAAADAGPQPVSNAVITAVPAIAAPVPLAPRSTTTGPDGHYDLPGLSPGKWKLTINHPEYPVEMVMATVLPTGGHQDVRLSAATGSLRGSVKTAAGAAIKGAVLVLTREQNLESAVAQAASADDGTFEMRDVPAGRYNMAMEAALGESAETTQRSYTVDVKAEGTQLDVVISEPVRLRGRVYIGGQAARPVAGSTTLLFSPRQATRGDARTVPLGVDGRYEVELEAAEYTVGLEDSPGQLITVPETGGELDLRF